jgi:hypothetical protein
MDRGHISGANALVRARKQIAYLRGICADPANFEHGGPAVATNFNPKTVAVLELTASILERGEQVVIVSARIGQTDEFCRRLIESIGRDRLARIDSTVPASHHNAESNRFKRGEARVMLMGIKCAKGYSYDLCPNLIVASLEYAYGSLHQAMGRVWRVASKYPVTTYCILHQDSIEETMFDIVATKKDAATICLHGERVPRDFHPVTLEEILASHLNQATQRPMTNSRDEAECESDWPRLRTRLEGSTVVAPWRLRVRARV